MASSRPLQVDESAPRVRDDAPAGARDRLPLVGRLDGNTPFLRAVAFAVGAAAPRIVVNQRHVADARVGALITPLVGPQQRLGRDPAQGGKEALGTGALLR